MKPRNGGFRSSFSLVTKFLRNVRQEKGYGVLQVPWARGNLLLSSRQTFLSQTFADESGIGFQLNQGLTFASRFFSTSAKERASPSTKVVLKVGSLSA